MVVTTRKLGGDYMIKDEVYALRKAKIDTKEYYINKHKLKEQTAQEILDVYLSIPSIKKQVFDRQRLIIRS